MRDLPRQGPSGILQRVMIDGSAPVTRLFRGKAWLHTHPRLEERITTPKIDPPDIYYRLCYAMGTTAGHTGYSVHRIGYVPGQGPDRHYPADITPIEVLWTERDSKGMSSNREYDERLLEPSRSILRRELDGAPILPVPVLFDRMHDVGRLRRGETFQPTTAFTPDMVNMQVLNGHLVVPKPYGPRMRVDDAVAVVRAAMTEVQMPDDIKSRVGRRLIAARRMTRGEYWVERVHPALVLSGSGTIVESYGGMETKDDVTAVFRDSFPTADAAERERRIIQPHLRHFDAQGWLKNDFSLFRFDDGMVDLFELWMAAIAAHLGVRLHFVDSWFYHLHDGQIHCGTNVLHRPPPSTLRLPNVWDSADHLFRTRTIEFPDEDVVQ
jgi:hypothetical protein